ncbi:MAG: DUF4358 domain-containing protein [Blautia sp.]|nr:DUF4358 domain-containing protein [Eubacteriales bacterium]MED9965683.1 DUF4358 domain-containing protein [Blautia sp.]
MKINKSLIIKTAMVLFLSVYLILLYTSDSAKNVPMDEISAEMVADTSISVLKKRGRTDLRRYYQVDEASVDGYLFYKAESPMSVDEIFIVKALNKTQAATLLESAQSHLDAQKKIFEGYGTDQMALLNSAVVEKKGNYVYYICGSNASELRSSFLSLI